MTAINQVLQHWFPGFDVFVEGFTFYLVFVAVPGKQCWVRIFHVNINHASLAYCLTNPTAHVLDTKRFCSQVPSESISLLVWNKPFSILV